MTTIARHITLECNVDARMENLEIALGTYNPDDEADDASEHSLDGLLKRVTTLETLTRVTQVRTCDQLRQHGVTNSGHYWIDPDGAGRGQAAVRVYCDMRTGSTMVTHQQQGIRLSLLYYFLLLLLSGEGTMTITKCREPGCSVHSVKYDIPMRQIEALILLSDQCEQYVR